MARRGLSEQEAEVDAELVPAEGQDVKVEPKAPKEPKSNGGTKKE